MPDEKARTQAGKTPPEQPQPAASEPAEAPAGPGIPTGFPEPVPAPGTAPEAAPDPDAEPVPRGHVRLATQWPLTELHLPPLEAGGTTVTITQDGTVVDQAAADRAHLTARLAGHVLREI